MRERLAGALAVVLVLAWSMPAREDTTAKPDRGIVIWHDPGVVEELDLKAGPGNGAPQPPFAFEKELLSGVNAKVKVKDASGRSWAVKWGDEAHAEVLASRLVWATGYFTVPVYFVPSGEIAGTHNLQRAGKYLKHGRFTGAAFQLWEEDLIQTNGWEWDDNPFVARVPGARELNGLKILMMLTSNWDNKDAKDVVRGSNTAVLKVTDPDGETRYQYLVFDWGGAMGSWGGFFTHSKWDCRGFARQSGSFVRASEGKLEWGYRPAQYTNDIIEGITVDDVRWIIRYLGKLTDVQLLAAAEAAGATAEQATCYAQALRERIEQLRAVAS